MSGLKQHRYFKDVEGGAAGFMASNKKSADQASK